MLISNPAASGWRCSRWGWAAALLLAAATFSMVADGAGDMATTKFALEVPAEGAKLIEVAVRKYEPPKQGPGEIVVKLDLGQGEREVGRFSMFPDEPFDSGKTGQPRRFRVNVPADLEVRPGTRAVASVSLVSTNGGKASVGGRLELEGVRFQSK